MHQSFTNNEANSKLDLQKKSISYVTRDFLGSFALFALLCIGFLIAGLHSEGSDRTLFLFVIMPLCLLPVIWFLANCVRTLRIRRQVMSIREDDSCEMQINCRKVRFLFHPKDRRSYEISVLLLRNEYDEEYCYVFPRGSEPLDTEKKLLRQHLEDQTITLICYRDTNFIKSLNLPKGISYASINCR